jgi:hypothetical protein
MRSRSTRLFASASEEAPRADAAHQLEPAGPEPQALVERSEPLLQLERRDDLGGQDVREARDADVAEAHGRGGGPA